tara:strand:- start:293 stop:517 length:225 start_codon:yes stop_codon:yes gene_type:complete
MTALELAKYVGRPGNYYAVPGLVIEVTVIDARMSWGQLQLQVQPTSGSGSKWVNAESLGGLWLMECIDSLGGLS